MVELGEASRKAQFEYLVQVERDLSDRSTPGPAIAGELEEFQLAWASGLTPQQLGARFRFQKVHDADCERRGILLYEIYVQRARYRAVVSWIDSATPGIWVAVFKKQGASQSKTSLRTAGARAVERWRSSHE